MKKTLIMGGICLAFILLIAGNALSLGKPDNTGLAIKPSVSQTFAIPFVEDPGQVSRFTARIPGGSATVNAQGEIVYHLKNGKASNFILKEMPASQFSILNPQGQGRLKAQATVFHGTGPKKTLAMFEGVSVGNICPGVALTVKAAGRNVEKLFIVAPGADPAMIRMKVEGGKLALAKSGELEVNTAKGPVCFTAPVAFQTDEKGNRETIPVTYALNDNSYGFQLGDYDRSRELVIDPLLASTYLGGSGTSYIETAYDVAVDSAGKIYVAGTTDSSDFPVTDGSSLQGDTDGFIAKFSSDLSTLEAAIFIGGDAYDQVTSLVLADGKIYAAGSTSSSDFPVTTGAYSETLSGNSDAFVCILDEDLSTLEFSTLIGGSGGEQDTEIAIGETGDVFMVLICDSGDFPMAGNPFDSTFNMCKNFFNDVIVARLSGDLSTLKASTYFGGSCSEYGYGYESNPRIALDDAGKVWIAGITESRDFPTTDGAFLRSKPYDAEYVFVSRLDADLSTLEASTLAGCAHRSFRVGLALGHGDVYVASRFYEYYTGLSTFPTTPGSYDPTDPEDADKALIVRFKGDDLSEVVAATFFGGVTTINSYPATYITDLAVDSLGDLVAVGITHCTDHPTTAGAYDRTADYSLAGGTYYLSPFFISRLDEDLTTLKASTYLGNQYYGNEPRVGLALDEDDNVYLCGMTAATNFPTTLNAFDRSFNNGQYYMDAFVSKLDASLSADAANLALTFTPPGGTVSASSNFTYSFTVTNNGPSAAVNAHFTHTLPTGTTFVSVSTQGQWSENGGTISCPLETIVPTGSVQIQVTVTAPATATSATISATVSSSTADPVSGNNAVSASVTITAEEDEDDDNDWLLPGCFISTVLEF
ncbi:MAG: SBBP repeat-containing protein [Proteobacteria bacterium]|nr:SBBP repeat-containing protein [Pseudomonadota bacterium]